MIRRFVFIAALAALLASAGPASARDWVTSHPLLAPVGGSAAGTPVIKLDNLGNATAALPVTDGSSTWVEVARRSAGGDWSAATQVTGYLRSLSSFDLAVDANGNAMVAWVQFVAGRCAVICTTDQWRLYGAYWAAGTSFPGGAQLAAVATSSGALDSPDVAFDGAGNAVLTWASYNNTSWSVSERDFTAATSSWGSSTTIASATSDSDPAPDIAAASNGDAVIGWTYQSGSLYGARADIRPNGGSWAGVLEIGTSQGGQTSDARALVANTGSMIPAVAYIRGGYVKEGYWNGSAWVEYGAPTGALLGGGGAASGLRAVMQPGTGTSILAWREGGNASSNNNSYVAAAKGYAWNLSTSVLSDSSVPSGHDYSASAPGLSIDSQGSPLATWALQDSGASAAFGVEVQSKGTNASLVWDSAPKTGESLAVGSGSANPPAGGSGGLDGQVLWQQSDGFHTGVFDATPPSQSGVSIPSSGNAGEALSFSAGGSDTWSGVTTAWSFGDGSSAGGATVLHSFGSAGTFAVRAVTTDAAGNQTVSSTQILQVGPAGSASGQTWLAPSSFTSTSPTNADIVVNGRGDALSTWTVSPDTCSTAEVNVHPAGGSWAETSLGNGCNPHVALRSDGTAVAIWAFDSCPEGRCVYGATRPPDGSWSSPALITSATGVNSGSAALAFAPDGTATAVWWVYNATSLVYSLQSSTLSGGSWSAPIPVTGSSDTAQGSDVQIVFDKNSNAALLWSDSGGSGAGIKASLRTPGGSWTDAAANPLVPAGSIAPGPPHLAVDSQGDFMAVWELNGTLTSATTTAASGTWTQKTIPTPTLAYNPVIRFDGSDHPVAAWIADSGTAQFVESAAESGGVWGSPQALSSTQTGSLAGSLGIATDGSGNLILGWLEQLSDPVVAGSTLSMIQVARRPNGAVSNGAETLASDPLGLSGPWVAADSGGDMTVMWLRGDRIETTTFDPAPPSIGTVDIPATAEVGTASTYTASASDAWGPLSYSWSFDGGAPLTGSTVQYTFPHASPHSVTLTVKDGAGNATVLTRSIEVTDPNAATTTATTTPVDPTPAAAPVVTPPPNTLPPPVLGESINVFLVKEPVYFKLPGQKKFKRLTQKASHMPNGTVLDTRRGRVMVVIDNGNGGQDAAEFYQGVFEVNQPKRLKGLANIFLNGGGFKGCPKAPKDPHAQLSRAKQSPTRSVRHLWGQGTGKFRTVGRFGSATVRGTTWLTDDRCNGTLFRVKAGKVAVRDFVKQKTIALAAPKSYFAKSKTR